MSPILQNTVLNGASRHCLHKGFLLVKNDGQPVDMGVRDKVVAACKQKLTQKTDIADFKIKTQEVHASLLYLVTPLYPIYHVKQRDLFIQKLAKAAQCLLESALSLHCRLIIAGVNTCFADGDEQTAALCADIHQIETFNEEEIERVYHLYRQLLPELLAISANSSIYAMALQKDFSLRMRLNTASFLPRYLPAFSVKHLDQLERTIRKDYGLADLRQMDVNPLGGDINLLKQDHPPLLNKTASTIELRFVDAQCSFPFIRAQMILFQAIAMYGRTLAREGKSLHASPDAVIDENKALAVQNGADAMLKPDMSCEATRNGKPSSYHSQGTPERATTALLITMEELLLPALQDLGCEEKELLPIVLGAELRRRGKKCLANYAEYQQYLWYIQQRQFPTALYKQTEKLLATPTLDPITEYNQQTYRELSQEIGNSWRKKLAPVLPRRNERAR